MKKSYTIKDDNRSSVNHSDLEKNNSYKVASSDVFGKKEIE